MTRDYRGIGELIVRIAYADALTKEEANDLMKKNEESVRLTTQALSRIYLVNFIPMRKLTSVLIKAFIHCSSTVKYIPAWVPGAGFQRVAARVKNLNHRIRNGPWEKVLKDIVSRRHSDLYYSQVGIGLRDSPTQSGGQTDRAVRCEQVNKGFGGNHLYR